MSETKLTSEKHWRRVGQQSRSEQTQIALLNAAETLIIEKGTQATSISDIAKLAGYSVGTLYHHFKDKKALCYTLFERLADEYINLHTEIVERSKHQPYSLREIYKDYLGTILKGARGSAAGKAAVSVVMKDYPELAEHYANIRKKCNQDLYTLALTKKNDVQHKDPERAIAFSIDYLSSAFQQRLDKHQQSCSLSNLDDDEFTTYVIEFAVAFLNLKNSACAT